VVVDGAFWVVVDLGWAEVAGPSFAKKGGRGSLWVGLEQGLLEALLGGVVGEAVELCQSGKGGLTEDVVLVGLDMLKPYVNGEVEA
jgi:hypothetical protein